MEERGIFFLQANLFQLIVSIGCVPIEGLCSNHKKCTYEVFYLFAWDDLKGTGKVFFISLGVS